MEPSAIPEVSPADHRLDRRRFLKWGALAAGLSLIPRSASASRSIFQPVINPPEKFIIPSPMPSRSLFRPPPRPPEKSLSLYNTHTCEGVNAVYSVEGEYL